MAGSFRSRKFSRNYVKKSKRNVVVTFILILVISYTTLAFLLPWFINGIGSIKKVLDPPKQVENTIDDNTLAPPVINIPYESTNSGTIDISGYATYGSQVKIYIDDQLKQTTDVKEDGSFVTTDIDLMLGINNIYGKTTSDGKESLASKTIKIIYDNEKPRLEVSEPSDNKNVQGERKLKISGITEPEVKIFINNSQTIVDKDGNFSTERQLSDGENNFEIKAEDSATNSTTISRKIVFTP